MAKTKSEPSLIDRIAAVHPKYAALLTKQRELLDRQDELQRELNNGTPQIFHFGRSEDGERVSMTPERVSLAERARRATLGWVAQLPKPKPKPKLRHEGAVELVGELLSPQPIEELNPPPLPPAWAEEPRYRAIGQELESIAEALKLLAPELTKARREYSELVVAQRREEYQALVESIVDRARAFGDEISRHHTFINQQREDGVEWLHYRPINMGSLAYIADPTCPLNTLIESAIEHRHVGAGKSPRWTVPANIQLLVR
ncbi:hypothetical protein [Bradyrhizobium macuxiense]|uniref:hypothetical protein n=1 Tax=Bradyrhizobium macuxiense TaxID=1755647 RepID=UPI000AB9EB63|nr:hypothetical protein [Bradyrhizobium macuxiense]